MQTALRPANTVTPKTTTVRAVETSIHLSCQALRPKATMAGVIRLVCAWMIATRARTWVGTTAGRHSGPSSPTISGEANTMSNAIIGAAVCDMGLVEGGNE